LRKGVYCYSKSNGYQKHYKHYLPNYSVTDILRDREGGLWLSTLENGVFYFPNENFINIENISPSKHITKIVKASNAIYFVSGYEKLFLLNPDNRMHNVINESIYIRRLEYKIDLLWVSSDLGLLQYDGLQLAEQRLRAFEPQKSKNTLINPRAVHPVTSKKFYSAGNNGIHYCALNNNASDTLHNVTFYDKEFDEVVTNFLPFKNGKFLIASYVGLYLAQPNPKNPTILEVEEMGKRHPVLNTRIDEIHFNKFDGRYYLATKEKGLLVWDNQKDSVMQISKKEGLADNLVSSIAINDSVVWVGTKQGLSKLAFCKRDFNKYHLTNYSKYNGLPTNEINGIAIMGGNVYVATNEGLCYFNPKKINPNLAKPLVYISKIMVNEREVNSAELLNLRYNHNDISIEFIGLSYRTLGNVLYKYKLSGIDTNWHFTKNRDVRFPKLQSGSYHFSVSAQNEDGIWSSAPAEFEFTIRPPFWQTTFFLVFLSLVIALLIMLIYNLRIREINKRNKQHREDEYKRHKLEEELISSKQMALIQQMNPHFMFNALNSIQSLMCENNTTEASQYLTSFAKLMRLTLENIQEQYITLEKELVSLRLYLNLEKLRLNNLMQHEIHVDSSIDAESCNIPTMLIQPYVENAIIHGLRHKTNGMGIIKIEFFLLDTQTLLCRIEDNGIGRRKSDDINAMQEFKHKSYGSKIVQKRLDLINSLYNRFLDVKYIDLEARDGQSLGTIVEVKLPITIS
jgi:two-component sensor histidine kinase